MTTDSKALVLGGGALKGAFQAGAVMALLENGFRPDALYGISVGGLNAAFLATEANRQLADTGQIDWPRAGRALIEFWLRSITRPQDVAVIRSRFRMGLDTLMSRFDGLLDNSPLHNTIRQHVDIGIIRQGPVRVKVGAVDVGTGEMVYVDQQHEHFMDFMFASSAIPLLMPVVQIGGDHRRAFIDGGLREVAPIREAIDDGLTDIACVACHARQLVNHKFNYRNVLNLMDRVKDITVNQIVNNDLDWAIRYADRVRRDGGSLHLTIVRPADPFDIDLMKFTSADISALIVKGYQAGVSEVALRSVSAE
jgi:NTE family protein